MASALATPQLAEVRVLQGQEPKAVMGRGLYRGLCLGCGKRGVEDSLLLLGIPLCAKCLREIVGRSLADRLYQRLREYEECIFVSQWLRSVKDVVQTYFYSKTYSRESLELVIESLRKIVGFEGSSVEDLGKAIDSAARSLEEKAAEKWRELEETAREVRERIWRAPLPKPTDLGRELPKLVATKRLVEGFSRFFRLCVGNDPWSIQRTWMYRVVQGQSFAMIAPTGVGKTTFGIVSALYLAIVYRLWLGKRFRSYIVVPTRVLVKQYFERLILFLQRLSERLSKLRDILSELGIEVSEEELREVLEEVAYGSIAIPPQGVPEEVSRSLGIEKVSRAEAEARVLRGEFYILITTAAYIHSKFNKVIKKGEHPLALPFLWSVPGFEKVVEHACTSTEGMSKRVRALVEKHVCRDVDRVIEEMRGVKIDYAFVDDVDAIMKGSKLIDYVLQLIGFDMGIRASIEGDKPRIVVEERNLAEELRPLVSIPSSRDGKRDRWKSDVFPKLYTRSEEGIRIRFSLVDRIVREASDRELADLADMLRRLAARTLAEKVSLQRLVTSILRMYASRLVETELARRRAGKGIVIVSSATGRARGRRVRFFRYLLGFDIGGRLELYRKIVDCYRTVRDFESRALEELLDVVKRLGVEGGLVFVPVDRGAEYAERLAEELRARGIRAEAVTARKPSIDVIDRFRSGELQVLVGVAIYYGLLVRGLDLPERVRYAVFVGVPRHKVNISRVEYSPATLMRILGVLAEVSPEGERSRIEGYMASLRRILRTLSAGALKQLVEAVSQGEARTSFEKMLKEVHDYVQQLLSRRDILEALRSNPNISVVEEDGTLYMLIPDAPTYIQASGRTSRLYAGGITQGISVVLVDDERLLRGLERRLRFYIDDFEFKSFDELVESGEISRILEEIDRDRERVKLVMSGKIAEVEGVSPVSLVKTVLIVVESPNKARTIARFFGRPSFRELGPVRAYEVDLGSLHLVITASGGHVYDVVEYGDVGEEGLGLVKRRDGESIEAEIFGVKLVPRRSGLRKAIASFIPIYGSMKRCLVCGRQFIVHSVCPRCKAGGFIELRDGERVKLVIDDKRLALLTKDSSSVVNVLKRLAMEVDEVVIGTDPDAEGEKIGFDLAITLAPFARRIERMEFHEVTRKAITRALEQLRGIDINMVEAQIARRIEDRWIGFALSDYIRLRIAAIANAIIKTLSAGRVQTPTLGYVIRRNYLHDKTQRVYVRLSVGLEGLSRRISVYVVRDLISHVSYRKGKHIEIVLEKVEEEAVEIPPPPPFTTDELLTEAAVALRMSVDRAMAIAQQLFEMGLITYHRTDSTRVSDAGIAVARQYLESVGLANLFQPRTWAKGVVGAHECIRPTRPIDAQKLRELVAEGVIELPQRLTEDHYRLYDLVFRRFMASQMKGVEKAKRVRLVVREIDGRVIEDSERVAKEDTVLGEFEVPMVTDVELYVVPEEVAKQSFLAIYTPPHLSGRVCFRDVGDRVRVEAEVAKVSSISLCVRMPNEGDIVRWMKTQNVGRPSTYAKIVSTLFERNYIAHNKGDTSTVRSTDRGRLVYTMLTAGIMPPEAEPIEEAEARQLPWLKSGALAREVMLLGKHRDAVILRFGTDEKHVIVFRERCEGEERCVPIDRVVELGVAESILYPLVSVKTTANLVRAMEEIEAGKRFYHTVLENVLAELLGLFETKLSKLAEEYRELPDYARARSEVYRKFVDGVRGLETLSAYIEFLSRFREAVKSWVGREITQRIPGA